MDALIQYTLPLSGLHQGIHEFNFQVDDFFFSQFENSMVESGNVAVNLIFDKRPDLIVMIFKYKGSVAVECDRCLEKFDLPIDGEETILMKYSQENTVEEGDIIYIPEGTQELKVATFVYEIICLAIPMSKNHEMAGASCDPEMLKYLTKPDEEQEQDGNPIWEALKSIRKN